MTQLQAHVLNTQADAIKFAKEVLIPEIKEKIPKLKVSQQSGALIVTNQDTNLGICLVVTYTPETDGCAGWKVETDLARIIRRLTKHQ